MKTIALFVVLCYDGFLSSLMELSGSKVCLLGFQMAEKLTKICARCLLLIVCDVVIRSCQRIRLELIRIELNQKRCEICGDRLFDLLRQKVSHFSMQMYKTLAKIQRPRCFESFFKLYVCCCCCKLQNKITVAFICPAVECFQP